MLSMLSLLVHDGVMRRELVIFSVIASQAGVSNTRRQVTRRIVTLTRILLERRKSGRMYSWVILDDIQRIRSCICIVYGVERELLTSRTIQLYTFTGLFLSLFSYSPYTKLEQILRVSPTNFTSKRELTTPVADNSQASRQSQLFR